MREKGFEHFYTFDLKIHEKDNTVCKSIVFFQHEMSAIHSTIYAIYLIFKNPVSKLNAGLRIHYFSGNKKLEDALLAQLVMMSVSLKKERRDDSCKEELCKSF